MAWTTTGDGLREDCQEAADLLGFAVPCPGVLPGERGDVRCPQVDVPADENTVRRRGCVRGEGFYLAPPVPSGEVTHIVITGGPHRFADCDGTEFDVMPVGKAQATVYGCFEIGGLHNDHVLAQWDVDGIWYEVSSHVNENQGLHEEIVSELVRGIDLISPGQE